MNKGEHIRFIQNEAHISVKPSQEAIKPLIKIKQKDPNLKFIRSIKFIQEITSQFFNDLCEEFVKLSIWSYKMRQVRKNTVNKHENNDKKTVASQFFTNWKKKNHQKKKQVHLIDCTNDFKQQNKYTNYIPISQNVLPQDFLLQLFPVIERIDLSDIMNELKMKDKLSDRKCLKRWFKIIKNMNLLVDLVISYLKNKNRRFGYGMYIKLLRKVQNVQVSCQCFLCNHQLNNRIFIQIIDNIHFLSYSIDIKKQKGSYKINSISNILIYYLEHGITIEKSDELIDPIIDITAFQKEHFCNKCYLYDCRVHSHEKKKGTDYYHPATFQQNNEKYTQRKLDELISTYYSILFNHKYIVTNTKKENQCVNNCYKHLTKDKILQIRQSENYPMNYTVSEKMFIALGEKRFYYNICSMSLLQNNFKCEELFIYVVEEYLKQKDPETMSLIDSDIKMIINSLKQENKEDGDDFWLIDDDAEQNNQQVGKQGQQIQPANKLSQFGSLSFKFGHEQKNSEFLNYLKGFVDKQYSKDELKMKQNMIQQDEESDEDEGLMEENNMKAYHNHPEDNNNSNNENSSEQNDDLIEHCIHYRHNKEPFDKECRNCCCRKRGFCDQYCFCDPRKCKIYRQGCSCKDNCQKNSCSCFKNSLECDPEYCSSCFNCKTQKCNNNQMTSNNRSRVLIANSKICGGMGLFNLYPLQKGDLIIRYLGEILRDPDIVLRDSWKPSDLFYIFSLSDELTVDSKYLGNKSRFMNHSKNKDNCYAKMIYVRGDYTIGLYAKQNISSGTELLFDYDGQGTLKNKYEWIQKKADSKAKQNDSNLIVFEQNSIQKASIYNKYKKRK